MAGLAAHRVMGLGLSYRLVVSRPMVSADELTSFVLLLLNLTIKPRALLKDPA